MIQIYLKVGNREEDIYIDSEDATAAVSLGIYVQKITKLQFGFPWSHYGTRCIIPDGESLKIGTNYQNNLFLSKFVSIPYLTIINKNGY